MGDAARSLKNDQPAQPRPTGRVGQYPQSGTKKLSVSLDAEAHQWVTELARAEGRSVSAVISDILNAARRRDAMAALLDELGTDDITPEHEAAVEAEWRDAGLVK